MRTALAALLITLVGAQSPPPAPRTVRMYVLDCGTLNIPDPMPLFGLKKEEVGATNLSNAAYLIVHPRGTLIWDTGFLSDSVIESGAPQTGMARATKTLKGQMLQAGYRPADITYLALSHYHGDHTGNANDFRTATWLVSQVEHDAMFAEPPPRIAIARHLQRAQEQQDRVCQHSRRPRRVRRRHRRDQIDARPHARTSGARRQDGKNRIGHADRRHLPLPRRSHAGRCSAR